MPTFCQWYDFGVRGIPPEELVLAYDSEAEYELPPSLEQKIENTWERITEDHPGLFNGPLLNLIEVSSEERRISLGPSQFRDYQFKRLVLSNHETTTDLELTAEEQEFLREEIHVLSSFVAIILDDAVLMGVKPKNSEHGGVLSFPGSGYLDRDEDCTDDGELKPTRTVIEREIDEELNVADRITGIKCLGVFDDAEDATHYNPAIFSIVEIDATKAEVKERITDADDSWEFAEFVFFPTRREDVLDSVLELAFANEHTSGEQLPGLDVTTVDGVTTKSGLMVLLLGRFWFGTDWYIERLDRYPSLSLEVATTELGEPTSRLPTGKLTNVQNANKLELSKWVAAADEGDQTLAWVNFVGSGEEPDRVRLQFDLVEKGSVPATDSIEDDSESEHTEDDSESESTRRTLLKTIGAAIPLSSIGGIAVETQGMPEALKHFWPNALYQKESEKVLDWATLDALLFDNQLGWGKFKTQSTEMIYDPDIVTEYDDVHLLSVFFRAIDENMITAIEQSANQAKTVYLYFVHPFEHHSKDTSALELHEEIELRSFRHLFSNVHWRRFYEDVVEHPANDRVPHPDSSRLNRIRANANALRCVQMGAFLTMNHPKIEVRLIDDHEVSLRGYIVEEKKASFVLNPKATIGTTPPRAGFITENDSIVDELDNEREHLSTRNTFDEMELKELSGQVSERTQTLLDGALKENELSQDDAEDIQTNIAALVIRDLDKLVVDNNESISSEWQSLDTRYRARVNTITELVNEAKPFTEPSERSEGMLVPDRLFKYHEQEVLAEFG